MNELLNALAEHQSLAPTAYSKEEANLISELEDEAELYNITMTFEDFLGYS